MRLRAAIALAVTLGIGCGGEIEEDTAATAPSAPAPFDPPPPDAVPVDEALLPLLDVPGGLAYAGMWSVYDSAPHFQPAACDALSDGSVRLRVGTFRLMEGEVTNAAYARCVDGGACAAPAELTQLSPAEPTLGDWRDPSRAEDAALVDYFRARAFCRHYGGDLPTYGEWARAVSAGASGFANAPLSEHYFDCKHGAPDADCPELLSEWQELRRPPLKRAPSAYAYGWDRGPYGHRGLVGGANEWVRSVFVDGYPTRTHCGQVVDDAGLYRDPDPSEVGVRVMTMLPLGGLEGAHGPLDGPDFARYDLFLDPHQARYFTGFRCAFPEGSSP